MKSRSLLALATLLCAIGVPHPAPAVTVEFSFGGEVQTVVDLHGVLDGSIVTGSRLTGSARYETELMDVFPELEDYGFYPQPIPPGHFVVRVGSYEIEVPSPMRLAVLDDFPAGSFPVDSFSWTFEGDTFPLPGAPGASLTLVRFGMDTPDTSLFSSDALPTAPLDIADFPDREITRFGISGCLDTELSGFFCAPDETIQIFGIVDSVPEPSSVASTVTACAALGVAARLRLARSGA